MESILAAVGNGTILGCALALVVSIGLRISSRRALNAATRYAVWWMALAAVVVLPVVFLPLPGRAPAARANSFQVPPIVVSRPAVSQAPAIAVAGSRMQRAPIFPLRFTAAPWNRWILPLWVLASALMLVRLTLSYVLLQREKRRAITAIPAALEQWLAQCGCTRRGVRLAATTRIGTPVAAGLWRPAILIPARLFEQLNESEFRQIGLHEAAHLARRDDYALLMQRILEALWVWHPAVRWIARQIDLEREVACDDFVLKVTGQARPYAACLTRVVELTGGVRGSLAAAAAAEERSHLTSRVDMLLDNTRNSATRLLKTRLLAIAAVVAALTFTASRLTGPVAFAMPQRPAPAIAPVSVAVPVAAPTPAPVATVAPAAPEPAPQPAPLPQSGAVVLVPAMVLDPMGRSVTGLDKENFRIFEDEVEQEVAGFSVADAPASYAIVFDASGSTAAKQAEARQAVTQFVNAASPGSEFCLVEFNDTPRLASGFTTDTSGLLGNLNFVKSSGGTSIREALVMALKEMQHASHAQKAVLIVSDGADNTSTITAEQARQAARTAGIPINAINLGDDRRGTAFLEELASDTGGRMEAPALTGASPTAAGLAIRHVYMLSYRPKNASGEFHIPFDAGGGTYHKIRVEVVAPRGLPPLTVRARNGYYR